MKVEYSYKWYLETCKENGLDPEHALANDFIDLAKEQSKKMKYFMDALECYKDYEKVAPKIQRQIEQHNERRMGFVLDALEEAEKGQ